MKKIICNYTIHCHYRSNGRSKTGRYSDEEQSSGRTTGSLTMQSGFCTDALGNFQESSFYLQRAEALIAKGDYSGAINDFNSANRLTPSSGEYGLARIYGLKGDAATAVYHLESCMKSSFKKSEKEILLDPSFSLIENRPEWRLFWKNDWYGGLEKGISEIEYSVSTGNIGEAKNGLRELLGLYPGNSEINYAKALINLADNKSGEAIKDLSTLLLLGAGK